MSGEKRNNIFKLIKNSGIYRFEKKFGLWRKSHPITFIHTGDLMVPHSNPQNNSRFPGDILGRLSEN